MKLRLLNAARIAAIAAAAFAAAPSTSTFAQSTDTDAAPPTDPFTITPLPFPTAATFKKWTSQTGTTQVCTTRCGPNGGSASPYQNTNLYGARYTSIPINSSATFVFKKPESAVAFIWGTPDRHCNVAAFYDSTGVLIGKIHVHDLFGAGYYAVASPTPISSIVFFEKGCTGDLYFEVAQGPYPYHGNGAR